MSPPPDKRILATGRHLRLMSENGWEYAERTNASGVVVIVAVTDDGKLLLIEQFRPPVGRHVVDCPAGLAGDIPGQAQEDLAEAAHRELVEETGYEAREMTYLGEGPSSAGMTSEILTFFRASGLRKVGDGGGDSDEKIKVHEIPLTQFAAWCRRMDGPKRYIDTKIFAGLYLAGYGPNGLIDRDS